MVIVLTRIMGNVTGPGTKKHRILGQVLASVLLYGAPVWAKALQKKRTCKKILSQQRRVSLRIIAGYRTVSLEAGLVIAGMPPLDLEVQQLIQEREKLGAKRRPLIIFLLNGNGDGMNVMLVGGRMHSFHR